MSEDIKPRPRTRKSFFIILSITLVIIGSFYIGFSYGENYPKNIIVQGAKNIETPSSTQADFDTFWQAWRLIDDEYLRYKDISNQSKVYGAIKGLVNSLGDPYSEYFPPAENKKFQEDIQGNFGGIGAELSERDGRIIVIAPLKNTPAEKAGIQAGDIILTVNGSSTDGINIDQAIAWIRGPRGSSVKLEIFREGMDKPREVNLVRATINVPTLDYQMKGDIAYVQLYSFNATAEEAFYNALLDVTKRGAKGMVLDLRNDPGGYLEVAVDIAGWFVPKNTVVVREEGRSENKELKSPGNAALKDMPLAVLINKGSASAAEILAGALRDILKTPLVGEKSFGKGTVQQLMPLADGSSVKLTIAHWITPSGKQIDREGLTPDFPVEVKEEDVKAGKDAQLEKALQIVTDKIK